MNHDEEAAELTRAARDGILYPDRLASRGMSMAGAADKATLTRVRNPHVRVITREGFSSGSTITREVDPNEVLPGDPHFARKPADPIFQHPEGTAS